MKTLIIYDSAYGNTEKIAIAIGTAIGTAIDKAIGAAIGKTLGDPGQLQTLRVKDIRPEHLSGLDLLIVGAPTQRFRTTPDMTDFLKSIPADGFKGVKVAAFDTRLSLNDIESSTFRLIIKTGGFAAKHIADYLKKRGGDLILPPEGFLVKDMEVPLLDGELDRAADWAKRILSTL